MKQKTTQLTTWEPISMATHLQPPDLTALGLPLRDDLPQSSPHLCATHGCRTVCCSLYVSPEAQMQTLLMVEVLLYVHRNRRLIRDGSPGQPPRLSHSSWGRHWFAWTCIYIYTGPCWFAYREARALKWFLFECISVCCEPVWPSGKALG